MIQGFDSGTMICSLFQDYYVADTSEDQVMLCVNHEGSSSHLYISDVNGTRFTVALEDILYFNPNTTSGPGTSYLR